MISSEPAQPVPTPGQPADRLERTGVRLGWAEAKARAALHAAPVLPADLEQRVRDLPERADANRIH